MSANEDSIRTGEVGDISLKEVTDMHIDARGTKATGVLVDDGFALRTDLEGLDIQMGKLQACLDGNASSTKADIPEDVSLRKIKCLKRQ